MTEEELEDPSNLNQFLRPRVNLEWFLSQEYDLFFPF